jgi:hypothetical protein
MKVSQHIYAGELTSHWISYDGSFQLGFGEDEVTFTVSEDRLRSLSNRLLEKIKDLDEKRSVELADAIAELKEQGMQKLD